MPLEVIKRFFRGVQAGERVPGNLRQISIARLVEGPGNCESNIEGASNESAGGRTSYRSGPAPPRP